LFVVHKSFPQLTTIDHDLYIDYNLIITLVKSQGCGKLLHFKNMKKQKLPLEKTHNIKEIISKYKSGWYTVRELAIDYGISYTSLRRLLIKLKVKKLKI